MTYPNVAYQLLYRVEIVAVPVGGGPMTKPIGQAYILDGSLQPPNASLNSTTFTATDITNLTNALAADVAADLTANIGAIQNWNAGGN